MDEINVVYASDDNYAMLAGISMISLFENNKLCSKLNVSILADNISKENKEKLYGIGMAYQRDVRLIDTSRALKELKQKGINGYANADRKGYTAYARLLIPDLITDKDRVIYLDCDTLVIGDIAALGRKNIQEKPIGLAYDCCQNSYKRYLSLNEKEGYYNTGVMILDIGKWKQKQCSQRIIWHMEHIQREYPLVDQDFINVVLHDDIFCLDMKYNYLSQYFLYSYSGLKKVYDLDDAYFYKKEQYVAPDEAKILHFCGQTFIRPWYCNSKHPSKKIYDYYDSLSPWHLEAQKKCNWTAPYKIQYLLWKYAPDFLAIGGGYTMQKLFMRLHYKV